jgi:hypothetical protein
MGKKSNEITHSIGELSSDKLRFVFVHGPVDFAFNEKFLLGINRIFAGWARHYALCGQPLRGHYSAILRLLPAKLVGVKSRLRIVCPSPSWPRRCYIESCKEGVVSRIAVHRTFSRWKMPL